MSYSNVWNPSDTQIDNNLLIDDSDEEESHNDPQIQSDINHDVPPPSYFPEPVANTQLPGGERFEQRRFMGGDTLDEPVLATLMRDVRSVGTRLRQVIWRTPEDVQSAASQDWDLWGPLVFCLLISLTMSLIAPNNQSSVVFSGVFALIWIGQIVVTLNVKLLGGTISFFHALCVTGYSLFPLVIAAVLSTFVSRIWIRLPIDLGLVIWAIVSATGGLKDSGVLISRVFLASYPLALFFAGVGWLCVIT